MRQLLVGCRAAGQDDTWEPVSAFEDNAMHLVQQYDMGRVNGSSPSK